MGWWPNWLWLLVDALAVYRLTRLVARDELLRPARVWLDDRYAGPLVYLVTCMWCLSIWLSAVVLLFTWWIPVAWSVVASGLAFSAVAGQLGEKA